MVKASWVIGMTLDYGLTRSRQAQRSVFRSLLATQADRVSVNKKFTQEHKDFFHVQFTET